MTRPKLVSTEEALAELGKLTPDEIAEKFRVEGIKGMPLDPDTCPVAVYLNASTGLAHSVGPRTWRLSTNREYAATPPSVSNFIIRMDGTYYPDLIG